MLTVCWAAKGGSGTTVTAVALALAQRVNTLLVDLVGDVPLALGAGDADACGVNDWLVSDAPPSHLARLEQPVTDRVSIVAAGTERRTGSQHRWRALVEMLGGDPRRVVVDAGTGAPPSRLTERADSSLLVTRPCYVALRRATRLATRPTGVILIDEPGRALRAADVAAAIGAPVVATLLLDPKIARAVDAGLTTARLPQACLEQLRRVA